jgi:hypothetical protein
MEKFVPQSPDKFLRKDADMAPAKFGHLNEIVTVLNGASDNVFASNGAALAGGLKVGDFYRTDTGEVKVVFEA